MSFGYSVGDFLSLAQLALTVVNNSRQACGEHDEFVREVGHLHVVLQRLSEDVSKPDFPIGADKDDRFNDIRNIARDCRRLLRALDKQLIRYNALTGKNRSFAKLWQQVRFGNGMMKNLNDVRLKVSICTSLLSLHMNLLSVGSQGRVERQMFAQGGELGKMRRSINWITATMQASHTESSILTSYTDDDKAAWKQLRRELLKKGFSSSALKRNKDIIKKYLLELGERGILDDTLLSENSKSLDKSEPSHTPRSESSLSGSERGRTPPPLSVSKDSEDLHGKASGSRDKGKARESTRDPRTSTVQEVSGHINTIRSTANDSDTRAESNVEETDHCANDKLSSGMTSSTASATICGKPVVKSAFAETVQDIDFPEEAHLNCKIHAEPSPDINNDESKFTSKGKGKEIFESPSEPVRTELGTATDGDDAAPKIDEIQKEPDAGEAVETCKLTDVKVFCQVVDLDDGSEYPVMATYLLPLSSAPKPPSKTVGSDWFQWQEEGSVWRILDVDQPSPEQIAAQNPKTRPPLPRVVVVQAGQMKETELQESKSGATDESGSNLSDPSKKSSPAHPNPHRADVETHEAAERHLRPPQSPEVATFVIGDRRGRNRTMYYRDIQGRRPMSYHRRSRPLPFSSPRRRGRIYYTDTRIPRALWQSHSPHADNMSDEEDWVDDPEGPPIIEVTYANEYEPRAAFFMPPARSASLTRAATVVVDPDTVVLGADMPEAGALEAGALEAGVPEVEAPEAEVPEAEVPEAEVPEAGVPEAGARVQAQYMSMREPHITEGGMPPNPFMNTIGDEALYIMRTLALAS